MAAWGAYNRYQADASQSRPVANFLFLEGHLHLVLASASAYRRALLARLGLPFESVPSHVDERLIEDELPADRAMRLSIAKAEAVASTHPDATVIGSDQVGACGNVILRKPGDPSMCREQLRTLSSQTARFHTGCAVLSSHGERLIHLDTTLVAFRGLTDAEITRYVAAENSLDCAGGFKAEGLGISLLEMIESKDPTALIGLPLIWLAEALRRSGFALP